MFTKEQEFLHFPYKPLKPTTAPSESSELHAAVRAAATCALQLQTIPLVEKVFGPWARKIGEEALRSLPDAVYQEQDLRDAYLYNLGHMLQAAAINNNPHFAGFTHLGKGALHAEINKHLIREALIEQTETFDGAEDWEQHVANTLTSIHGGDFAADSKLYINALELAGLGDEQEEDADGTDPDLQAQALGALLSMIQQAAAKAGLTTAPSEAPRPSKGLMEALQLLEGTEVGRELDAEQELNSVPALSEIPKATESLDRVGVLRGNPSHEEVLESLAQGLGRSIEEVREACAKYTLEEMLSGKPLLISFKRK